jgi:5-methylcytosine-specific restriction endonuclease McrA
MVTHTHNENGHRRRELVKRVKATESDCALCDEPVDKTLTMDWGKHSRRCTDKTCRGCVPHDRSAEVDEDIPRSRGGSPYERSNCHLMHRACNRYKGNMTLAEARAKFHGTPTGEKITVNASPIW